MEAEVAALETRSAPAELEVSPEGVRRYLAKLRQKVAEHAELQRVLFLELQREHDLQVRVAPSGEEFTASIALPTEPFAKENAGAPEQKVLMSVLKSPDAGGGPRVWRKVNDASATFSATLFMALRSCRARFESFRSVRSAITAASPAITKTTRRPSRRDPHSPFPVPASSSASSLLRSPTTFSETFPLHTSAARFQPHEITWR